MTGPLEGFGGNALLDFEDGLCCESWFRNIGWWVVGVETGPVIACELLDFGWVTNKEIRVRAVQCDGKVNELAWVNQSLGGSTTEGVGDARAVLSFLSRLDFEGMGLEEVPV
jgi:hypothetical protein